MLEDLVPPHRPSASSSLAVDPCSCSSGCHHVLQLLRTRPPLAVPCSSPFGCCSLLKLLRLPFPAQAPPTLAPLAVVLLPRLPRLYDAVGCSPAPTRREHEVYLPVGSALCLSFSVLGLDLYVGAGPPQSMGIQMNTQILWKTLICTSICN